MGLDMSLNIEREIGTFIDIDQELDPKITNTLPSLKSTLLDPSKIIYEAAYWRKVNAIHNWFINNVQSEEDDCGLYTVSVEKLQELKNLCDIVRKNPDRAEELLPTISGFFFGSTEYDEYYFNQLEYTSERLDAIISLLQQFPSLTVSYYSSW